MAAIWNRLGHYIFILFIFLSFFLAYSQPSHIGCLLYFHILCGLSQNFGCRSETCYTRLAENTGRKNRKKIRHLRTIAQLCWAISSQLRDVSTVGEKLVKQQYPPTADAFIASSNLSSVSLSAHSAVLSS